MAFIELHQYRCDLPILINIQNICAIEQGVDYTCVYVASHRYCVTESYDDIVAFMRDNECGVF